MTYPFDHLAIKLALRARLLALSVATTGSTTLSATATGYTRAAGSFVTDGFLVGQEVTPAGFTETAPGLVTSVSALSLGILGGRSAESNVTGSLSVGLPALRAYEAQDFTPTPGRWYLTEQYLPGSVARETMGSRGQIEAQPLYIVTLYAVAGYGEAAAYAVADAALALYPPDDTLTLTTGDVVRIRSSPAPYRGQLLPVKPGWGAVTITVPLKIRTANSL